MSAPPSVGQTAAISAAQRSSPCRNIFGLIGFVNAALRPQLGEEVHLESAGELRTTLYTAIPNLKPQTLSVNFGQTAFVTTN